MSAFQLNLQPLLDAQVTRMLQDPKVTEAQNAILDKMIMEVTDDMLVKVENIGNKLAELRATPESRTANATLIAFYERQLNRLAGIK